MPAISFTFCCVLKPYIYASPSLLHTVVTMVPAVHVVKLIGIAVIVNVEVATVEVIVILVDGPVAVKLRVAVVGWATVVAASTVDEVISKAEIVQLSPVMPLTPPPAVRRNYKSGQWELFFCVVGPCFELRTPIRRLAPSTDVVEHYAQQEFQRDINKFDTPPGRRAPSKSLIRSLDRLLISFVFMLLDEICCFI